MASPADILGAAYERVSSSLTTPVIHLPDIANDIELVCRNVVNRACVRVLLACSLAKCSNPFRSLLKIL
jgi:hypothetical protein